MRTRDPISHFYHFMVRRERARLVKVEGCRTSQGSRWGMDHGGEWSGASSPNRQDRTGQDRTRKAGVGGWKVEGGRWKVEKGRVKKRIPMDEVND